MAYHDESCAIHTGGACSCTLPAEMTPAKDAIGKLKEKQRWDAAKPFEEFEYGIRDPRVKDNTLRDKYTAIARGRYDPKLKRTHSHRLMAVEDIPKTVRIQRPESIKSDATPAEVERVVFEACYAEAAKQRPELSRRERREHARKLAKAARKRAEQDLQ